MSTVNFHSVIEANNDGLIMATGYELAIVKNGKIIAAGNDVANHAFNATGDSFINCFSKIVDIREFNTPQHNYTTPEGVPIPHAGKGVTA